MKYGSEQWISDDGTHSLFWHAPLIIFLRDAVKANVRLNANSATNTQTQEDGRFGWPGRENQKHSTYIVLHTSLVLSHI